MILKFIRFILGYTIVGLSALFSPRRQRRTKTEQQAVDQATQSLALYEFYLCPFCVRVRRMIRRLNLSIEYRDAKNNAEHRERLLNEGGRIKVPCLRIEEAGKVTWMYESRDINDYLSQRFA